MTTKAKDQPTTGVDDNGLAWEDVVVLGTTYRLREISVEESDVAFDASQNPDKTFNPRLNQRLQLASSIVTPPTTLDEIGKWGIRKLVAMLNAYDRLNSLPAADTEGNG
jgi:hypothetical protein